MFLGLANNFCILFTFTVLSYWPFQDHVRFRLPFSKLHPLAIGLMSGVAGLVLMKASIPIADGVFVDARSAVIVISGIFGGPLAPFISAMVIGIGRILFDGGTTVALIAGMNVIIAGVAIALMSVKKPMTFRNAPSYFIYFTIQAAIVLIFLMGVSWESISHTLYFVIYSLISFFTILIILRELSVHFRKIEQLESLSETDYLTGLNNNRKFQEIAATFSSGGKESYSILVLDLDHFKKVNDTYGHPIGDEVLIELASRLKKGVSSIGGLVSRNGGEEFSIILPGFEKVRAIETAENIRKAVASLPFTTSTNISISVTVSIGVSNFPENGSTMQQLYNQADIAMYKAKKTGRNKTVHIEDVNEDT